MSAREQIWQFTLGGLIKGLAEARELEKTNPPAADIKRASVLYSYRIPTWKRYADKAAKFYDCRWESLTDGQCDVIGTLFIGRDNAIAVDFLSAGLNKNPPPHSEALLHIGLAEAHAEEFPGLSKDHLEAALALEPKVLEEKDQVQAQRQFGRVLRRAAVLYQKQKDSKSALDCFEKAWAIATHPQWGSWSQRLKLSVQMKNGLSL